MKKPSLPLLALRTFVEVGQHSSIKIAAQALSVTSGAVSQQIRLLEERVGTSLLIRDHQGVRFTEAGALAHPQLCAAFERIEGVVRQLEGVQHRKILRISTVPNFAASWLVPRLGRFTERHPDIEVRVEATSSLVDLRKHPVDIALRHGLGYYPGLQVTRLITPIMVPVASPALLGAGPRLINPEDCLNYPLLHDADRADWALWLKAHNVGDDSRAQRGTSFEDDLLLMKAAEAGQGLALVAQELVRPEVEAGRLVQALDHPWPMRFSYYLLHQKEDAERAEIKAFTEWVLEEMEQA